MEYAVLTGDIIGSTQLTSGELDKLMWLLSKTQYYLSHWPDTQAYFARRGGDGWQMVLSNPKYDLRAALYIRARLLTTKLPNGATRIALASGDGDMADQNDPNRGHGPAFTASGRLLETLKARSQMAHAGSGAENACIALADHISQGWTQAQARALRAALPPESGPRAQAAAKLGISRQSVNDALWSAGFPAIERALSSWESP